MLDVAFLADDPELGATGVALTRSLESVDAHGRTVLTPTTTQAQGAVLPATPQQLERLDAADRVGETVAIYTPVLLTAGSDSLAADVVTWQGREYEVFQVEDYTTLPGGFCVALARAVSGHGRSLP
jgi:hypothetical protein